MTAVSGDDRLRGYVLAGGGSTRFGRDKALATVGGVEVLARMISFLLATTESPTIVGSPEKYALSSVPVIADRWPGEGPLGGIITALHNSAAVQAKPAWNLVIGCDMPFLTVDWLKFLGERTRTSAAQVVLAHSQYGPEPLCACWRTDAAEILESGFQRGVRKVTEGIALLRSEVLDAQDWKRFDSDGRLFWNMNTPQDYEEACRIVEAAQS